MPAEAILRVLREGIVLVILLSAAPMLASMLVGLLVSLLQATTQVQEQTLSFVPKLLATFVTLAILGPWMLEQAVRFTAALLETIPLVH
ncbi:MAG TPA: flagellar biosynthetic protein FliQ [Solibacterales bacterium]|nr:flagellar biosynthetic protein FliQ [Bryobacterales bacterium]